MRVKKEAVLLGGCFLRRISIGSCVVLHWKASLQFTVVQQSGSRQSVIPSEIEKPAKLNFPVKGFKTE